MKGIIIRDRENILYITFIDAYATTIEIFVCNPTLFKSL